MRNPKPNYLTVFILATGFLFLISGSGLEAQVDSSSRGVYENAVSDLNAGGYKKAEQGFRKILEQDPENINAHYYLGLVKYVQQNFAEAALFFQWVQKRVPQMPVVHYYLGLIAYDQSRWDEALKEMETAKRLDSQLSMVHYYLGLIHYKNKEITSAKLTFQEATRLEPSLALAHYALAYLLFHDLKEPKEALAEIKTGLKGELDQKLRKKLALLREEIEGPPQSQPQNDKTHSAQATPAGFFAMPPFIPGSPGFLPFMAGPPDAPDFRDRPLLGPDFRGASIPHKGFELDINMWKEKLALSNAQFSKIGILFKQLQEDIKSLNRQMKADRNALQSKVDTKASDREISILLVALSKDRRILEDLHQQFENQLQNLLTTDQRAKFILGLTGSSWLDREPWMNNWKDNGKDESILKEQNRDMDIKNGN